MVLLVHSDLLVAKFILIFNLINTYNYEKHTTNRTNYNEFGN